MKKLIMTKGLPGSGKSTWAKQQLDSKRVNYKRINKDDLRAMLDNNNWSKNNERFVLDARDMLIKKALEEGFHVIVDDTNLDPKHEARLRELVREHNVLHNDHVLFQVKDFTHVQLEVCIRQDLKRMASVGERVIREAYYMYLAPRPNAPAWNNNLPMAILCDLDGTLALLDRNPFNASECDKDEINKAVAEVLKNFYLSGNYHILFVSGREDKYKAPTELFLQRMFAEFIHPHLPPVAEDEQHQFAYHLYMRRSGDYRKDSIIKREVYEQHIKDRYNVLFVLDDRNQVVDMWRNELGLVCFQVDYGEF